MTENKEINYGTVLFFSSRKGFGFIKPDVGAKDYFVHYSQVVSDKQYKTLTAGQRVSFTLGQNKNGVQAENVTVIEDAPKD